MALISFGDRLLYSVAHGALANSLDCCCDNPQLASCTDCLTFLQGRTVTLTISGAQDHNCEQDTICTGGPPYHLPVIDHFIDYYKCSAYNGSWVLTAESQLPENERCLHNTTNAWSLLLGVGCDSFGPIVGEWSYTLVDNFCWDTVNNIWIPAQVTNGTAHVYCMSVYITCELLWDPPNGFRWFIRWEPILNFINKCVYVDGELYAGPSGGFGPACYLYTPVVYSPWEEFCKGGYSTGAAEQYDCNGNSLGTVTFRLQANVATP